MRGHCVGTWLQPHFSVKKAKEVPAECSAYICVKARLRQEEILKLAERGPVTWDIVDDSPPEHDIFIYLASTEQAPNKPNNFAHFGDYYHAIAFAYRLRPYPGSADVFVK